MLQQLNPRHANYAALLDDIRFFNFRTSEAEHFKFLGDWYLKLPVTKTRLALAKYNYYHATKTKINTKEILIKKKSIKSKLERYTLQDPEDILAIIKKINLNYKNFFKLFEQMFPLFIGDPNRLIMHARSLGGRINVATKC